MITLTTHVLAHYDSTAKEIIKKCKFKVNLNWNIVVLFVCLSSCLSIMFLLGFLSVAIPELYDYFIW